MAGSSSVAANPPRVTSATAAHTVGRRSVLPNGRAVAGGLLVAAAAIGTFAAWSGAGDGPSTSFVVAAADLPIGHVVTADDVTLAAIDAPPSVSARAFASATAVVGQRTVAPLAAGDLLQRSAVVVPEADDAGRQVSFAIDLADGLAGTLEEGEAVDLLATYAGDDGPVTEVVAAGARVARLPTDGADGGRLVVLLTLTPDTDVLAVTTAIRTAELTLVRAGSLPPLDAGAVDERDGAPPTTADGG